MKPLTLLQAALALAFTQALHAQTEPPKPEGSSDPFVKAKSAAAAKPNAEVKPAAADNSKEFDNVLVSYEIFAVPQADYHRILESGLQSADAYREVESLVKGETARLEDVLAITTRSGQRAVVEQVDEVHYATEFAACGPRDEFPLPVTFEMRGVGSVVEHEPVISEDHALTDINFALQSSRLNSFDERRVDPSATQGTQVQPVFESRRVTSAVSIRKDEPRLVGTINRATETGIDGAEDSGTVRMVFARARSLSFDKSSPPAANVGPGPLLRISTSFYSMNRADARRLLNEGANGDILHAGVLELIKKEAAKLERVLTCVSRSGERTTCEEVHEFRFGSEIEAGGASQNTNAPKPHSIFRNYEMRPLGWRMEVDPVLGPDGSRVDVNIAPEFTRFCGMLHGNDFLEKRLPPKPVFEVHKVTTSVSLPVGHHALLGTFSSPGESNVNGRQDDGNVWFAFLRVDVD